MSTPFCNNLKKGDPVLDTITNRPAKVARTPQSEQQRMVALIYQGTTSPRYADVMQLRLIVEGKAEAEPPVTGEPPPVAPKEIHSSGQVYRPTSTDPLEMLRERRASNIAEIDAMTKRATELRHEVNRIDNAILALSTP